MRPGGVQAERGLAEQVGDAGDQEQRRGLDLQGRAQDPGGHQGFVRDLHLGEDMYESFVRYQKWLLAEFDKMVETFGFQIVDASGSVEEVFENLRDRVDRVIARNGYGS